MPFKCCALAEALTSDWQVTFLRALRQGLNVFLETSPRISGAAREVIAQHALLPPHLVCGEKQRYRCDADDQGQDDFQSRAHLDLRLVNTENGRDGLGAGGRK